MTKDEARALLAGMGVIRGDRMHSEQPSHDRYHEAIGVLCGKPWDDYGGDKHLEHHLECGSVLSVEVHPFDSTHTGHSELLRVAALGRR